MTDGLRVNDAQLRAVGADLVASGARVAKAAAVEVDKAAEALEKLWVANATASAGEHGKHYPASISSDRRLSLGSLSAEVGPDASKPQGGMSFEYGSRNQPPHLDGNRAADVVEPKFAASLVDAVAGAVLS